MTNIKFNWSLFDGESGEGASTATSDGIGSGARDFLKSLGDSDESINNLFDSAPNGEEANEETVDAEQFGNAQEEESVQAEETFQDLIKKGGKYHDEYGQMVSQAIQQRFRNQADYESTVAGYNEALSPLFDKYGIDVGDIEGLSNAISQDDSNYSDGAEREGLTVEQYRRNLQLQREAERGREIAEAYEAEQRRNEMYAQWDADAEQLKEVMPNFDLGAEIQNNESFANLIDNGVSVRDAFFATHANEILSGLSNESSADAKRDVVNNIKTRAARPPENGMRHNPATTRKLDPSQFTDDDMDRILRDVANGKPFKL